MGLAKIVQVNIVSFTRPIDGRLMDKLMFSRPLRTNNILMLRMKVPLIIKTLQRNFYN